MIWVRTLWINPTIESMTIFFDKFFGLKHGFTILILHSIQSRMYVEPIKASEVMLFGTCQKHMQIVYIVVFGLTYTHKTIHRRFFNVMVFFYTWPSSTLLSHHVRSDDGFQSKRKRCKIPIHCCVLELYLMDIGSHWLLSCSFLSNEISHREHHSRIGWDLLWKCHQKFR